MTRPIRNHRRSKEEIEAIECALFDLLADENPMTVRQIFYRMVSLGAIDKTEAEYKGTICRLLARMRKQGVLPFGWIADNTRWMRKPQSHTGMEAALMRCAETYRRDLWAELPAYVEIWLEKDALAGVLYEETHSWDVPLMVTRGYPSLSYLYEAAEAISARDKPAFLYYFGDYDPSGVDIPRTVERSLREYAPEAEIYFERMAVSPLQIEAWGLPTRPTKKTDSRSKNFEGESVEVDAIPPQTLRELVRECVVQHIDADVFTRLEKIEAAERETLMRVVEVMGAQ